MFLYRFDPVTGRYLGSKQAAIDEWQSEIKGSTAYKGEANAVWDAPSFEDGCTPYYRDGTWVNVPDPTLEEAKAAKLTEINAACDAILDAAVSSYPQSEVLTFDQQVDEVRAYQAGGKASDAPLLSALASARGITLDDLIQRVISKRQAFSMLSGYVIGHRQRLEDRLDECQTTDEVKAIVVDIKIPEAD